MPLEQVKSLGHGGGFLNDKLPKILTELQGLTISFLAGAAANASHVDSKGPLFGVDTMVAAFTQDDTSGVLADVTATQLIVDTRPTGTMTVGAAIEGGNTCNVNGKTYTAVTVTPSQSNRGIGPQQFYSGLQTGEAANGAVLTKQHLLAAGMTNADADTVLTTANKEEYIAAWSLAQAIHAADGLVLTASATLASGVVTIYGDVEAVGSYAMTSGTNLTRGAATITGGAAGKAYGTVTLAAAVAADFVTIGGVRYTAIANTLVCGPNQFPALALGDITVGGACAAQTQLMAIGLTQGQAQAILTAASTVVANNAMAYILAFKVNANNGSVVTASADAAVVNLVAKSDGADGAAVTLTSSSGTPLAVSAATLTAAARGWKNSASAATKHLLVVWFKKSRVIGQA